MSERRYTDDEVALILERASQAPAAGGDPAAAVEKARGLSLRDVQAIAAEVGIDVEAVSRAALAVERGDLVPATVCVQSGAPMAISKTIDFGRDVDDRTWARMVVHLQETFAARGRLRADGAFREWSNGNLRAVLEPTERGHRLRISTRKGNASALQLASTMGLTISAAITAVIAIRSGLGAAPLEPIAWVGAALPGVAGLAGRVIDVLSRVQWGRERAAQMDALPEALRALLPSPGAP